MDYFIYDKSSIFVALGQLTFVLILYPFGGICGVPHAYLRNQTRILIYAHNLFD